MPGLTATPKILFASYDGILDPGSGAAISTQDQLLMLSRSGWDVRVLCGPLMDRSGRHPREVVQELKLPSRFRNFQEGGIHYATLDCRIGDLAISTFLPRHAVRPDPAEVAVFLDMYRRLLDRWRPDVVLTCGINGVGTGLMDSARRRGLPVVYGLHNNAHRDADFLRHAHTVLVASQYCADHYRNEFGLECAVLPTPVVSARVKHSTKNHPRFVTFVNPSPKKGVTVVARIAAELGRIRPEIPILIVEGRSGVDWLARCGVDLRGANIRCMKNTADPRQFYSVSKIVLMPSLCHETLGRVAIESMVNGLPLLATHRGALPEMVADGGFLFEIPDRYTPENLQSPEAVEVKDWIDTIIRLWDDPRFYNDASARAMARADDFSEARMLTRHNDFFRAFLNAKADIA